MSGNAAFVREPGCVCTDPSFVARAGHERRCPLYGKPITEDKLAVMAHRMTDEELRVTIESIIGNPKHAGYRARRLNMGESLALAALMAEEANRVRA